MKEFEPKETEESQTEALDPEQYYLTHEKELKAMEADSRKLIARSQVDGFVPIDDEEVLALVDAYYGRSARNIAYYICHQGQRSPAIPEGSWVVPVRLTYVDLQGSLSRELYAVPIVETIDEAFAVARQKGMWAGFRAASAQRNLEKTEVLLSGKFLNEDETPLWHEVNLQTPRVQKAYDQATREAQALLRQEGYIFPED